MARANTRTKTATDQTFEGAPSVQLTPMQKLERSVLACLLWEDTFYEEGEQIAERITRLVGELPHASYAEFRELLRKARGEYKLRHAPLWLILAGLKREAKRDPLFVDSANIAQTIQRADELSEIVAMYWKDGKKPLPAQLKTGLAEAFHKFDEYQLAKYDRESKVRLRDVMFMVHPQPHNSTQSGIFKRLAEGNLETPDTWEVGLSSGANKRETFERLLQERKLGYMALLRNLRNMREAGVDEALVRKALEEGAGRSRVLPFRFVAAARAVPQWEWMIEAPMLRAMEDQPKLPGKTVLLNDVSGSMSWDLSKRSTLAPLDTGAALAMLCREVCEDVSLYSFSAKTVAVPARRGFALADAIGKSQQHTGTNLGAAVEHIRKVEPKADRLIVFTDEQSHDRVGKPVGNGYMINIASYSNGVGYGDWTRITGFSEAVIDYIRAVES